MSSHSKKHPRLPDVPGGVNDDIAAEPPRKQLHPFFSGSNVRSTAESSTTLGTFTWKDSVGTCLHGVNLDPKASSKIAAFDFDGTVIKDGFSSSWEWWRLVVPSKLKELHDTGYAIVLISNQAGLRTLVLEKTWKTKIVAVANAMPTLPFRIFAATAKDQYRKPMPGMWRILEQIFLEEGVEIDKASSFYVGDAAGRHYAGRKSDFSSSDRKFALNIGVAFWTPEEYFLKLPKHNNYTLPGFHVSSLPADQPLVTPTASPIIPTTRQQEIVLFVGAPCVGKSSLYRRYFQPEGYVHANQDNLKTRDNCIQAVRAAVESKQSCVVDNTNRNVVTRAYYVDIAKKANITIRCFVFKGSMELAWHNNLYRAYVLPPSIAANETPGKVLPYAAFTNFRDNYEEPKMEEGFTEMRSVNWVFQGTEEERRQWSMWLQVGGK